METPNAFTYIGDPDLCMDLDGCTIASLVVLDRDVLLNLTGGFGWWKNDDGDTATVELGDENPYAYQYAFTATYWPEDIFLDTIALMQEWREASLPLRLLAAPGKITTLRLDENNLVALARTPAKAV